MTKTKKISIHFLIACILIGFVFYCRIPDINTCSKYELISLETIGEKKAEIIIENRPYKSYYDLLKIKGIGEKTIEVLKKKTKLKL